MPRSTPPAAPVVLISPYEIGRQPHAIAHAAAHLRRAGIEVRCVDLSLQRLDAATLLDAAVVAVSLGMHTATRIALEALPRLRELAPAARLIAFGLYGPVNRDTLLDAGFDCVFGGEPEAGLLAACTSAGEAEPSAADAPPRRAEFLLPWRDGLPPIRDYAHLILGDGSTRVVGFAEATRGCKHLCRHCPVVPVYAGRFFAIPVDTVIADIAQQIAMGAQHVSFGDPDFFNGPTHARRVVEALHARFPEVSYDVTVKVEHLVRHADLLPMLARTGCSFIVSAVESVEDDVLLRLDKGHTAADFEAAARSVRAAGIAFSPTFVAFTPWTTLPGYRRLLQSLLDLELVHAVPPVQLSIRLLIPAGSRLLELDDIGALAAPYSAAALGHAWQHPDPAVDALQAEVQQLVERAEAEAWPRQRSFAAIWRATHAALGMAAPDVNVGTATSTPRLSEPWYCCAEPTSQQIAGY